MQMVFEGSVVLLNRKNAGGYTLTTLYDILDRQFQWQKSRLLKRTTVDPRKDFNSTLFANIESRLSPAQILGSLLLKSRLS